ncbi:MAG: rRNA maturation RNase YbeY [Candidatus Omnitrophica bacterium]|nr:rRNA maturation RNase YbeY [Candidatus Omnitrophota bacterium]
MRPRTKIKVLNLNESYSLCEDFIKKIVLFVLNFLKKPQEIDLEIIFLDDDSIRRLNKRYKRKDLPTDVLSFKIDRREFGVDEFLGEILISADRAFHNAKIFESSFERELALYVIHGILHLLGYDDEKNKDRVVMRKIEQEILCHLCGKEDLSKVLTRR